MRSIWIRVTYSLEQCQVSFIVESLEWSQSRIKTYLTVQIDYFVLGDADGWPSAIVCIIRVRDNVFKPSLPPANCRTTKIG